jgi:hypothetical protein
MFRLRVPGCVGVLILMLAVCSGTARGQNDKYWDPNQRAAQQAENFEKQREYAQAQLAAERRAEEEQNRKEFQAWLQSPLVWCAVAALVLSVMAWVYVRLSATTDPRKLAASDPWIRARLAQGGGNEPAAPPDAPVEK